MTMEWNGMENFIYTEYHLEIHDVILNFMVDVCDGEDQEVLPEKQEIQTLDTAMTEIVEMIFDAENVGMDVKNGRTDQPLSGEPEEHSSVHTLDALMDENSGEPEEEGGESGVRDGHKDTEVGGLEDREDSSDRHIPQTDASNDRPFVCIEPKCDKRFKYISQLIQHKRIHTGEKPFKCDYNNCDKGFKRNSHLVDHKRIHMGEKPFDCNECGKRFVHQGHLSRHKRTHSLGK